MKSVFELEPLTQIIRNSYILSYPYLVGYFEKDVFSVADVVRGAHMVYGWMPTILELNPDMAAGGFGEAARVVTQARSTGIISDRDLTVLSEVINNSLVGASKLLHFAAPHHFAIWDSNTYSFVFGERPHAYRLNKVDSYRAYLKKLTDLQSDSRFKSFHESVNTKIGYDVSPLRALELVMYVNAPRARTADA